LVLFEYEHDSAAGVSVNNANKWLFLSQPMENTHISESTGTLGAFPHTHNTP